jgi:hypothetical protein
MTIYRNSIQTVDICPVTGIMFQLTKKSDYLEHTFIDSYFSCFAGCDRMILVAIHNIIGESEQTLYQTFKKSPVSLNGDTGDISWNVQFGFTKEKLTF